MSNIVYIYNISGNIFQGIEYTDINDLINKLTLLITQYDYDISIQLLINNDILYNFDMFYIDIFLLLNDCNIITIVFGKKKELYCLSNENGKYILDYKNDNYSKLLNMIIRKYKNDSYDIIMNSSYKELVLKAVKKDGYALSYASIKLKNDKEIVLEAVKEYGPSLSFINIDLRNDIEIVLEAVKQNGYSLEYADMS